jgi:hypothetical protein
MGYMLAAALLLFFLLHRWAWNYWKRRAPAPPECRHDWRSIVQPYARQCRKCGLVVFREGHNGEFPEGLKEYFDYVKQREGLLQKDQERKTEHADN